MTEHTIDNLPNSKALGQVAAAATIAAPPNSETLIERDSIFASAGIELLTHRMTPKEAETYNFWKLNIISTWKTLVHAELGRYPQLVIGHGFLLLDPCHVPAYAEDTAHKQFKRTMSKFLWIISKVRNSDLTSSELSDKREVVLRLKTLKLLVDQSAQDVEEDRAPLTDDDDDLSDGSMPPRSTQ